MSLPVAILAGGLATRLRPITEKIPKALVEVAGKPFAVHQIELLRRHGISRIVFCIGYRGEMVVDSLGDGSRWGVDLRYVFDGPTLLGTGGALRLALPQLGNAFMVLYGDSYLDCDYRAIEIAFLASGKQALMTVYRNEGAWDTSNVVFHNGQIIQYDKRARTPDMRHIDYGLGLMHARALATQPENEVIDLADIYKDLLAQGQLAGFEVNQRFYEIGSPDGLAETDAYLARSES
jgi:NDP-sugar pyrophosphorylase family protein